MPGRARRRPARIDTELRCVLTQNLYSEFTVLEVIPQFTLYLLFMVIMVVPFLLFVLVFCCLGWWYDRVDPNGETDVRADCCLRAPPGAEA